MEARGSRDAGKLTCTHSVGDVVVRPAESAMLSPRTLGRLTPRSSGRQRILAAAIPSTLKARPTAQRFYSTGQQQRDDGKPNTKGGNHQSTLSLALTYGALITTTALVVERWYYGSPAKRYQGKEKPGYGTPEDFLKAIETLRQDLSHIDGGVSTDPDDLHAHGFSANDYHPGTVSLTLSRVLSGCNVANRPLCCNRRGSHRDRAPANDRRCGKDCESRE